jgi:hypothetical protein
MGEQPNAANWLQIWWLALSFAYAAAAPKLSPQRYLIRRLPAGGSFGTVSAC